MFHRQLGEPLTVGEEHRARNDGERSGTIPDQSGEGRLERGGASHGDGFYGETYGAGGGFGLVHGETRCRVSLVPKDRNARRVWHDDSHELESLAGELALNRGHSRDITARLPETRDKPELHRITAGGHHDGNGRGRPLRGDRGVRPSRDDEIHLKADELRSKLRKSVVVALRPTWLKANPNPKITERRTGWEFVETERPPVRS